MSARRHRVRRQEDVVDHAVEVLRLRGGADADRRIDVADRTLGEDLPELLAVDEQEHEAPVEDAGNVGPVVGRQRKRVVTVRPLSSVTENCACSF